MPQRSVAPAEAQLKVACDACNSAKVKCNQERPVCRRCEAKDLPCQYSKSQRVRKKNRPSSAINTSSLPSTVSSTASNNLSSVISSKDVSMSPPSDDTMNNLLPNSYNQGISFLDNETNIASMWEDWNPDFTAQNFQSLYPDPNGDSFPPFPSSTAFPRQDASISNSASSTVVDDAGRSRALSSHTSSLTRMVPAESPSSTSNSSPISTANPCCCQQKILHKLSELSHIQQASDHSIPFDQSLSKNKSILSLCTLTINCTNRHHETDVVLLLTHLALLTHVVKSYDQISHARYQPSASGEDNVYPSYEMGSEKRQQAVLASGQFGSRCGEPSGRVRLSLGSYELDHHDEELLQGSLLKIELSKVKTLVEDFERRFHHLEWDTTSSGLEDGKPLGEVITWLKSRLRAHHIALTNRGLNA